MRLLAKSEIVKAKATAQRQSIDEGVKLARRIDSLREAASEEEASLERFRKEAISKIHADIKEAAEERDTLITENKRLKREREELQKPLDEEWTELFKAQATLSNHKEEIGRQYSTLAKEREHTLLDRNEANRLLRRAENAESMASEKLQTAARNERETGSARKEAKEALEQAEKIKKAAEQEFIHRDMEMASKERGVILKMESMAKKEIELREWAHRLLDKEQELEREFNRLKKKK